ncbi:hypothetical protein AB0903_18920 [Streptomyces sp. NPDC048389]|uniref:hypothetical protein n=1 Tax=Streptomyces sp. NPDC048389 TaxID=3154622 RepID=UPI0034548EB9
MVSSSHGLPWHPAAFPLAAQQVKAAYARVRASLVDDALLMQDAARYGFTIEELDRRMQQPPARLGSGTSWDWLDGPEHFRWAVLRVLVEACPPAGPYDLAGRVVIPGGTVHVVGADLRVSGDLVLEEQAVLFVLGGLSVTGALVGRPDYSMVAAREIECGDGATGGEILALDGIRCPGTFYFGHNDYTARASSYDGGVLVDFERVNAFGRLNVRERVSDWDFPAAARALGVSADEGDMLGAYTERLLSERGRA